MGRGKERDGLSPAEAYRKQQRKKELEKNRRQREAAREVKALQHADTASVRAELVRLQQLDRTGQLDNAHRGVVNRVAELYQKRLIESPADAAATASTAPAPKRMRPTVPAGARPPAAAAPPPVPKPSPVVPSTAAAPAAPAAPTGPTEIVLGTGGLMPTSLRVRRTVKKCPAPAPQPPAPQPQTGPTVTDEMARFEEEMKQLGAL